MWAGSRVRLTPFRADDSPTLFRWINEREDVLWSAPYRPVSEAAHARWFESIQDDANAFVFAIRGDEDRLLGYAQLVGVHWIHRSAELRIRLGEETERGRGLGTEAVGLLLDFAFRDLALERVTAFVLATNARARRTYEKAGFALEGRMRRAAHVDGEIVDVLVMGALREERR